MIKSSELKLSTGRTLYLRELRQFLTYDGLLEGLPTVEMNREMLDGLVSENHYTPYLDSSPLRPHLIRPTERLIELPSGRSYPFGTPSALPAVTCIGRFTSLEPAGDKECDYSLLVVIWFQEEFAFPIDHVRALDWESLAADLEY